MRHNEFNGGIERERERKEVWVGWLFAFFLSSPKGPVSVSAKPELSASFSHYAVSGFMVVM